MQINDLTAKIKKIDEEFKRDFNYVEYEKKLNSVFIETQKGIVQESINEVLNDKNFLTTLSVIAGLCQMKYEGRKMVQITILNGQKISVLSHYFYCRCKVKQGRPKDGRKAGNQLDCHLGLSLMGFINKCSLNIADEICKMAILCPSIDLAKKLLEDRGIVINEKTIRKICRNVGNIGLSKRGYISADTSESFEGVTLVIGIDGGRIREREKKRGKKKDGQTRQGYHTEWREPKLFTIYAVDNNGKVIKKIEPFHDATMYGKETVFEIVKTYLDAINIDGVSRIVFCGDGAPWIWSRVEELIKTRLQGFTVYQVLDYTHAKQALGEIFELLPKKNSRYDNLWKQAKEFLWDGKIDQLKNLICEYFTGAKKVKALKKWKNYFDGNRHRMSYKIFRDNGIPCGSGSVESAIRRVINLRLKSAGSFWTKEMAEIFLFLRSQLISGRWNIFWGNLRNRITLKDGLDKTIEIKTNYQYGKAA